MARTLPSKRYGAVCVWCCLVFLFMCGTAGVQAAASNSSGVTSDDHTDDGDDGRSTVEKGMTPFYHMVKSFLGVIQPHRISDQPWLNLTQLIHGDFDEGELKDWKNWAEYLVGFLVCVVVGVLFFLVMPITGLIFCCLRCCGKCGGRPKPQDPKHARCKRNTYCSLLVVLNTVALAGVVCAFLSNQILYEKLQNQNSMGPTGKIVDSADSVNQYTNDTIKEIEVKVLRRFVDTSEVILISIGDSAVNAVEEVLNALDAPQLLSDTKAIATGVLQSLDDLVDVGVRLHLLSYRGQELADNLTVIKSDLDSVCAGSPACPGYDASDYTVTTNFSSLDDLATQATNVNKSVNLAEEITEAEKNITNAKNATTQSVESGIDDAKDSVAEVEASVKDAVQEVTDDLQSKISAEVDKFRADMLDLQEDISTYSKYVWYAGIGISSALLLIVVVYYIGILFGLCGERPGFGAQCCNTGAGANFLMAGVGMTFLLSWLIMLVCIILFAVGGPLYTELCRYFDGHNPRALQPFNDALMDAVDLNKNLFDGKDVDLDLVNILEECKSDKAIYYVLRLDYMVNLTHYTDLSPVRESLDTLKGESLSIPNITILTPDMNQSITNFATSGLDDIQFQDYYTEINKDMTQSNLQEKAQELRSFANTQGLPQQRKEALISVANQLDELHDDYVVPMQRDRDLLRASINSLEARVQSGVESTVNALVKSLITAQDNFNGQKDQLVEDEITKLINVVMTQAESLVAAILNDVQTNIGQCRPVFDSFYSISDAACVATLEPMNAVWFSIGWCLFFFVPCLIFAVKLAGLYRREHEERDFDDPNFSQYMDGKQDSIPLTSRQQSGDGQGVGVANRGYQDDSYMGPTDYPHYKGHAAPTNYQDEGYMRPAPPPYGSHPGGHGEINPPAYTRGKWQNPGASYPAPYYPSNAVGRGRAPRDAN